MYLCIELTLDVALNIILDFLFLLALYFTNLSIYFL